MKPPKYIKIVSKGGSTAMRLKNDDNEITKIYWRDAGNWGFQFKERDGKFYSVMPTMEWLHNLELTPITKAEWLKDNAGYV